MPDSPSCIVVGAGVFGAAAADSLARRGWEVTLSSATRQRTLGAVRAIGRGCTGSGMD